MPRSDAERLADIEADRFTVETPAGRLTVSPASRLTAARKEEIILHAEEMVKILRAEQQKKADEKMARLCVEELMARLRAEARKPAHWH